MTGGALGLPRWRKIVTDRKYIFSGIGHFLVSGWLFGESRKPNQEGVLEAFKEDIEGLPTKM